jgi:probable F420-dependent oxidoreductase
MSKSFRFSVTAYEPDSGREWVETAQRAEDLGYSTLFTADHYLGPGPGTESSGRSPVGVAPLTACMAAAQSTTTLRVGCRVFCVDYHQPIVLAKELATLDLLSDGRLEVGLGAGWLAPEYEAMGLQMDRPGVRIERLGQVARLLREFWSGEQLDFHESHVHAVGFAGRPLPVQKPHPPLLLGGGSPKVLGLAGQLADIVSFNFSNARGKIGPESISSSSHDATAQKVGWVREGAGERFGDIELEIGAYFVAVTDDFRSTADSLATRFGVTRNEIVDNPHALLGSVGAVCEQVIGLREQYGITYINVPHRNMLEMAPVVAKLAGA